MSISPKVSVIIPVYKVENYISRCIKSLQAQTLTELEFIFIDDCGGDNSIPIIEEYAKNDDRIKILCNEANIGAGKSRNRGIDAATGEFIAFVDGDDWIDDNFYEVLYNRAKEGNYDIVKGRRIQSTYMEDGRIKHRDSRVNTRIKWAMRKQLPLFCFFTAEHQSAIFNRKMVHKHKAYNGSSSHSENSVFLLNATFHAKHFCIDGQVAYYYFQREDSSVHVFDYKMFAGELDSFKQQMLFLKNTDGLRKNNAHLSFMERKIKYLLRRYAILQDIPELKPYRKEFVQTVIDELSQIENVDGLRQHGLKFRLLLDGKADAFIFISKRLAEYSAGRKMAAKAIAATKKLVSPKRIYKNGKDLINAASKGMKQAPSDNAEVVIPANIDFTGRELVYLQNHRGCTIFSKKLFEANSAFANEYIRSFNHGNAHFQNELPTDSALYNEHLEYMKNNEICWRYSKRFGHISKTTISLDEENTIWFHGEILGDCDVVETAHFFIHPQATRQLIEGVPLNQYLKKNKKRVDDELLQYTDFIFETFKTDSPEMLQGIAYDAFPFNCILAEDHTYNVFDLEFEYKNNIPKGYMLYKIVRALPAKMQRKAYYKLCEHYGFVPMWEYWDDFDCRIWLDTISAISEKQSSNSQNAELFAKYFL